MTDLLHMALANAVTAALLAVVVAAVTFPLRRRRPAVVHALWLVVLLKLVTPPFWPVPVGFSLLEFALPANPAQPNQSDVRFATLEWVELPADAEIIVEAEPPPAPVMAPDRSARVIRIATRSAAAAWGVGSLACVALLAIRSAHFRRLLRHAAPVPPDVRDRAARLARRLGLRQAPSVEFIPGAVCPMLWSFAGRARLLLPERLWARLDDAQRDTLIAHELAHLRRRDDLVRLIEVAATVLYWWNPVLWWARRGLREAEEQCCDAWVVWSMPSSVRHYMTAILEAVEFVSEPNRDKGSAPPGLPALASGLGEFRRLERRLWMIRRNESPRRLSRAGMAAVLLVAAGALPLAPSLAEDTREVVVEATGAAPAAGNAVTFTAKDDVTVTYGVDLGSGLTSVVTEPAGGDGKTYRIVEGDTIVTHDTATGRIISKSEFTKPGKGGDGDHELMAARAEVEQLSASLAAARKRLHDLQASRGMKPTTTFRLKDAEVGREAGGADNVKADLKNPVRTTVRLVPAAPSKKSEHAAQERLDVLEKKLAQIDELLSEIRDAQGMSGDAKPGEKGWSKEWKESKSEDRVNFVPH